MNKDQAERVLSQLQEEVSSKFMDQLADCFDRNQIDEMDFCPYCGNDLFKVSQIVGGGRFVVCSTCEKIWRLAVQYEELSLD